MEKLIKAFTLDKVGKSGARFDPDKAKWYNQYYLREKPAGELAELFQPVLKKKNITFDQAKTEKIIALVKDRVNFIDDLWDQSFFFYQEPESYDEKGIKKFWKEETPAVISDILTELKNVEPFNAVNAEDAMVKYVERNAIGFGKVMNPLRLVIVGEMLGPHLFDILEIIGRVETVKRIEKALHVLK
jgi:glutamyl-tRNA synthetase